MGQTLTHGVYLPDEGERNCYNGLAANWQILDTSVGTIAAHTAALAGKAPLVHTHTKSDITDFPAYGTTAGTICEGNDSRLSDARTPVAHTHTKSDVTDLFNSANTWTASQTFTDTNRQFPNAEKGVRPSSNNNRYEYINDKNGVNLGSTQFSYNTAGELSYSLRLENLYDSNNQLSPNGSTKYVYTSLGVTSDGTPYYKIYGNTIPNNTNRFDLGTSANQWNNLYAKNYYYNGVAWGLDKANVWTTYNTFTEDARPIRLRGSNNDIHNVQPQSAVESQIAFVDKNNIVMSYITFQHRANATETHRLCLRQQRIIDNTYYSVALNNLGNFYPENNAINLGTSTNKWKTLNGVNPGSLSFPSGGTTENTDWFNVAGSILPTGSNATDLTGGQNFFTPSKDGWLCLVVKDCSYISVWDSSSKVGQSLYAPDTTKNQQIILPVLANHSLEIRVIGSSWFSAKLIMPKGNV